MVLGRKKPKPKNTRFIFCVNGNFINSSQATWPDFACLTSYFSAASARACAIDGPDVTLARKETLKFLITGQGNELDCINSIALRFRFNRRQLRSVGRVLELSAGAHGLCRNRTNGKDSRARLGTSLARSPHDYSPRIGRLRKIQDGCLLCILKSDRPND